MYYNKQDKSIFLIQKLNQLNKTLSNAPIDLTYLRSEIEELSGYEEKADCEYLDSLLNPEIHKGAKIPSAKPTPTCSFQISGSQKIKTYSSGVRSIVWNPFVLPSESFPGSAIEDKGYKGGATSPRHIVLTDFLHTGTAAYNDYTRGWQGYLFTYYVPDVFSHFRLVSAAITFEFADEIKTASGVIGGGVLAKDTRHAFLRYKSSSKVNQYYSYTQTFDQWANFNSFMNSNLFYKKEYSVLEGLRMLYFPLSTSFYEFKKVLTGPEDIERIEHVRSGNEWRPVFVLKPDVIQTGFIWCFYASFPTQKVYNLLMKYFLNFECIPKPKFLSYIPVSVNIWKIPQWQINDIIETMSKHAITKLKTLSQINYLIA